MKVVEAVPLLPVSNRFCQLAHNAAAESVLLGKLVLLSSLTLFKPEPCVMPSPG
ncbi:MAG: hypothetical protein RLZZ216_618 [Cyanobacteriota bacterium]|jgi:hypothetical protein